MRIVVTGGAGFVGSHLADALIADGHDVLIIDDLSTGREENIPSQAEFLLMDIRDWALFTHIPQFAPDAVCHLAAQISVLDSIEDPENDRSVNFAGSLNILVASMLARFRAFVNFSTGIVYGEQDSDDAFPLKETCEKKLPFPYSESKFEFEKQLFDKARNRVISALTLRPGNIYGPRQDPHGEAGVVAIFCERLYSHKPLNIHGEGTATRDYVYVDDTVKATLLALYRLAREPVESPSSPDDIAFNIGTGIGTNVLAIADTLEGFASAKGYAPPERTHGQARPGEVPHIRLDSLKARNILGWNPSVSLEAGLRATFEWFDGKSADSA